MERDERAGPELSCKWDIEVKVKEVRAKLVVGFEDAWPEWLRKTWLREAK